MTVSQNFIWQSKGWDISLVWICVSECMHLCICHSTCTHYRIIKWHTCGHIYLWKLATCDFDVYIDVCNIYFIYLDTCMVQMSKTKLLYVYKCVNLWYYVFLHSYIFLDGQSNKIAHVTHDLFGHLCRSA